jgi:hypothetical protein|nr:MAG TPA_asm: hypothetical protein [Caudoviricetes sp.]
MILMEISEDTKEKIVSKMEQISTLAQGVIHCMEGLNEPMRGMMGERRMPYDRGMMGDRYDRDYDDMPRDYYGERRDSRGRYARMR